MNRAALALAGVLVLAAGPALAADIAVTPATFAAAFNAAQPGDRLLLAAGTYGGLYLANKAGAVANPIVVTSADPANRAVLTNFNMQSLVGVRFTGLDLKVLTPAYVGFNVYSGQGVTFDHVHCYGPLGAPDANAECIRFFDGDTLTFTDNEVEQVAHGATFSRSSHVKVLRNHVHNVSSDTLDFSQVAFVEVRENVLHDFFVAAGAHPDAMQFGTAGSTAPSHDVDIIDNLVWRGAGQNSQGIYTQDEVGTLPYANFRVIGNLVLGTGSSGIRIKNQNGVELTDNTVVSFAGLDVTNLLVQFSTGVVMGHNAGVSISAKPTDGNSLISDAGAVPNAVVSDQGAAYIRGWAQMHPDMASVALGLVGPAPADPSAAQVASLTAQVAALNTQVSALTGQLNTASAKLAAVRAAAAP